MANRVLNWLMGGTMLPAIGVSIYASSVEETFDHSHHEFDLASGHTVPVAIRGIGEFYITPFEWAKVAPIWHVAYAFMGFFILVLIIYIGRAGYSGFMKEWRSDNRN
jgi:hypothetical protein